MSFLLISLLQLHWITIDAIPSMNLTNKATMLQTTASTSIASNKAIRFITKVP
uniref:Uncharacterized protein n=1 Tax=Physcomitrium patens TaxID=3218 RepID=A0A2K1LB60_PHYPA|nr:hypothetical protein PHYPA_001687 [Physcomitrium patens]